MKIYELKVQLPLLGGKRAYEDTSFDLESLGVFSTFDKAQAHLESLVKEGDWHFVYEIPLDEPEQPVVVTVFKSGKPYPHLDKLPISNSRKERKSE